MNILIIEDSKLQRKFLVSLLVKEGHTCVIAKDGEEGLQSYIEHEPDLVILDVTLPGMQGGEVAQQMRQHTANTNKKWVPILFLSGTESEEVIERCIQMGGDDYLFKPVSETILLSKIFAIDRINQLQKQLSDHEKLVKDQEHMSAIQEFSIGIAQEIRNPLASIVQNSQNLIRRLDPELAVNKRVAEELGLDLAKVHEYVQKRGILKFANDIHHAGNQVSDIISHLLRITQDQQHNMHPAYLSYMVNQAIKLLESEFPLQSQRPFSEIALTKTFAEHEPMVNCANVDIEQVIYSVLKNASQALKFTSDPEIAILIFEKNAHMVIEITDNGDGISEENLSKIFSPFFTTRDVGQGIGLGLTVAYNIINTQYHGDIEVKSTDGQGTCIKISIPLDNNAPH